MTLRISSAVLLTRRLGDELEVYLVKRNDALRFFGGFWALPGGVVDRSDRDVYGGATGGGGHGDRPNVRRATGSGSSLDPDLGTGSGAHPGAGAGAGSGSGSGSGSGFESVLEAGDIVHARCALRELFEETGVLPGSLAKALDPAGRRRLRAALLADEGGAEFRALLDAHPDALGEARPFARLTTPPFAPVRHRTRFLHIELPPGEVPEIIDGELTAGLFGRATDLVDAWLRGEHLIVPPVLDFLRRMRGQSLEAFFEEVGTFTSGLAGGWSTEVRNTPGIWMLPLETPTIPPATTTNCYTVGHARLFVVDPATYDARERRKLFDFLEMRRGEGRTLAGVIATHHHADHVGSIGPVAARFGLPVYAHPRTLERLPAGLDEARALRDGDELDLGLAPDGTPGWKLRAYHTPGHDQGHLAFVESRYDAALVGDLCSTVSTIVIDPPEGHMATYLTSLERMRAVPMGMLYPAHGPPARDGHALIGHYLAHRAAREAKLLSALGTEPRALPSLLTEVYDDVAPEILGLAARSLLAGLQKLAEEGRAELAGESWRLA